MKQEATDLVYSQCENIRLNGKPAGNRSMAESPRRITTVASWRQPVPWRPARMQLEEGSKIVAATRAMVFGCQTRFRISGRWSYWWVCMQNHADNPGCQGQVCWRLLQRAINSSCTEIQQGRTMAASAGQPHDPPTGPRRAGGLCAADINNTTHALSAWSGSKHLPTSASQHHSGCPEGPAAQQHQDVESRHGLELPGFP